MMETAMLKVFTTERLWDAVMDAFQIHGGAAYFTDLPLERMIRDARINQIGEGSNEVLTSFTALVGMRGPGMEFKELYDTMLKPTRGLGKAWTAGMNRLGSAVKVPVVPVRSAALRSRALEFGRLIWKFNFAVNKTLVMYREPVLDMQLVQERIAVAAMEMFASACVISRLDSEMQQHGSNGASQSVDTQAGKLFLTQSFRRIRTALAGLHDNDDKQLLSVARAALGKQPAHGRNGK
jgi:alkylation response protein AidB-like acyl-CoA dehydrogenase